MKTISTVMYRPLVTTVIIFLSIGILSCQENRTTERTQPDIVEKVSKAEDYTPSFNLSPPPISQFIRRIFEDSHGNLWLGTNGDGVFRYNGNQLERFAVAQGFDGYAVRAIKEDTDGVVWFATSQGLIHYDGKEFTNHTIGDSRASNDLWSLLIDSKGLIWVGGYEGVHTFDGEIFTPFTLLPETPSDPNRGVSSTRIMHAMMEDSKGDIWFATNGGAFIYDGKNLSNISKKEGLCNNNVNDILEDNRGNIWFATHNNGVCRWDGTSFTHFTENEGVAGIETWSFFKDREGNIWFPIENSGIYKYDGNSFTNYDTDDGLQSLAIQSIYQDRSGRIWIGGYQGLSYFDGKRFLAVTSMGPWPSVVGSR